MGERRELPSGTVTFLFSDVEGSTRLLESMGDSYQDVLARHQALLREAFEAHGGSEVSTAGDSFFVAFGSALDAVGAALDAQLALDRHADQVSGLRVRMGLHTCEAMPVADDYVGLGVHLAARIMSAAHGGQVLLSSATADLVQPSPPDRSSLRAMGEHRLKDLTRPERLFQLCHAELGAEFPPPRTLDPHRHNLPVQPTPFVGRTRDVERVREMLARRRLVTLTGPGGIGKTRLALQVAADSLNEFDDGVWLVPLASLWDAEAMPGAILRALGVELPGEADDIDVVVSHLRPRSVLLVLDNLEQISGPADVIATILDGAPNAKILATSREPVHLKAENEYAVPSLAQAEGVRLFSEVALSVTGDFKVTAETAPVIAQVCERLEGLPLAIELAASRAKVLAPTAMLDRFERRLDLPEATAADVPARHRTLRATIRWSYDLLDSTERDLFRRLAAFTGSADLDAIEVVCGATLEGVASLIDRSLLRRVDGPDGSARFGMLETIREFAAELLTSSGEEPATRLAHANWCASVAEAAEDELRGPSAGRFLARLQADHDNLIAALRWSLQHGRADVALRIAGAAATFWRLRGYARMGIPMLEQTLAAAPEPSAFRAAALLGLCALQENKVPQRQRRRLLEEAEPIAESAGDPRLLGRVLLQIALLRGFGQKPYLRRALVCAQQAGDEALIWDIEYAQRTNTFGAVFAALTSPASFEEGRLRRARETGDKSAALAILIDRIHHAIDVLSVADTAAEALELARDLGDKRSLVRAATAVAQVQIERRQPDLAEPLLLEALELCHEMDEREGRITVLMAFTRVARLRGDREAVANYQRLAREAERDIQSWYGSGHRAGRLAAVAALWARPASGVAFAAAAAAVPAQVPRTMLLAIAGTFLLGTVAELSGRWVRLRHEADCGTLVRGVSIVVMAAFVLSLRWRLGPLPAVTALVLLLSWIAASRWPRPVKAAAFVFDAAGVGAALIPGAAWLPPAIVALLAMFAGAQPSRGPRVWRLGRAGACLLRVYAPALGAVALADAYGRSAYVHAWARLTAPVCVAGLVLFALAVVVAEPRFRRPALAAGLAAAAAAALFAAGNSRAGWIAVAITGAALGSIALLRAIKAVPDVASIAWSRTREPTGREA
jgi:predicted ATPase/class 3 adenylate cyclase